MSAGSNYNTINCNNFLKLFYKISYHEKHKSFHQNISRVNKINKSKYQKNQKIEQKFEQLTELQLKPMKKNTKENVIKKLHLISQEYNKKNITKEFNSVLKVFQSKKITLKHFNEIMKGYFMTNFNGSELTCLYEMFGDIHHHPSSSTSLSYNSDSKFGCGFSFESSQFLSPNFNQSSLDIGSSDLLFYNDNNGDNNNGDNSNNNNDSNNEESEGNDEYEIGFGINETGEEREVILTPNLHNNHHHNHYDNHNPNEKYINCQSFVRYFYQLTKNDKENFIQKKNYISNRIQRIKKEYEDELEKEFVERKTSKVKYPDIPNVNLSAEVSLLQLHRNNNNHNNQNNNKNDHNNHNDINDNNDNNKIDHPVEKLNENMLFLDDPFEIPVQNSIQMKRKKTRKLSVLDSISPNRHVLQLFKKEKSLVNLYPAASEDTKVKIH